MVGMEIILHVQPLNICLLAQLRYLQSFNAVCISLLPE